MKELLESSLEVDFQKGETIIKKGFVASSIIYLKQGLAKLDIEIDGKPATVGHIPEKLFVGIMCTFARDTKNASALFILYSEAKSM